MSPTTQVSFFEQSDLYYKGLKLDRDPLGRREDHTEHLDFLRENMYPGSKRRSPVFSDDSYMHYNHSNQEELYHRRPPPHYDTVGYDKHQRLSPLHNREEDHNGHRDGFKKHSKGFNNWVRTPKSPVRIQREELPSNLRFHSDHQQREAKIGKRREEQRGGWERFRDLSPRASSHAPKWEAGWEQGRRNTQSSNRERQREDSHRERSPLFRRERRKPDDVNDQHGYRNKEFEEQHYAPRDKFGRDAQGSLGPLIIEHDHGIRPHRKLSRERFDKHQAHGSDVGRPRSSHPMERYRTSEYRLDSWENVSGRQDDGRSFGYPETRRNPVQDGRTNAMMFGKQKGKTGFDARARMGRSGPHRIQTRMQESSHGFLDAPHQEQSSACQPFVEDNYKNPDCERREETRSKPWMSHRSRSLERSLPDIDLDPKMPRQRMLEWNCRKPKNVAVIAEETLTIKVDMTQPVNKNSVLCYSSDRQLSLDLVNVGRQRLDFLPMLEHSGTYRETPMHTGTFAQEIITLVHHVKEQYFGGRGITLNERFSAPQKVGSSEDKETEKPTLNQRFSSNQGSSVNVNSMVDEEESSSSSILLPPVRGPGDLRHDLERRRQEKIEGVKVTIAGSSTPQRPSGPANKVSAEYKEDEVDDIMEPEEFSQLPAQHRRQEFNMGSKRGGPHRPFKAFQCRNYGIGNQFRPMKRQKRHNFQAGPNS